MAKKRQKQTAPVTNEPLEVSEEAAEAYDVLANIPDINERVEVIDGSEDTAAVGSLIQPGGIIAEELMNHKTGQMQDVRPRIFHKNATSVVMYKRMPWGWDKQPIPKSNMIMLLSEGWSLRAPAAGLPVFPVYRCPECDKPFIDQESAIKRETREVQDEQFLDLGLDVGSGTKTRLLNKLSAHVVRYHSDRQDLQIQITKRLNEEAALA